MKAFDNKETPQVGKFYNVRCAKIQLVTGAFSYTPVIGSIHSDPQFGTSSRHIHIDGRFIGKKCHYPIDVLGQTNHVIWVDQQYVLDGLFVGFVTKRRKCRRLTTGINPPNPEHFDYQGNRKGLVYWTRYKSMIGKSCKGRRCPHFGTMMHERDGKLICPLHNLEGDIETELIINKPEVDIA